MWYIAALSYPQQRVSDAARDDDTLDTGAGWVNNAAVAFCSGYIRNDSANDIRMIPVNSCLEELKREIVGFAGKLTSPMATRGHERSRFSMTEPGEIRSGA